MTTTPDNTATTWRDLADQLTDQQQVSLARFEAENVPAETLLQLARDHIAWRLADIAYSDVPAPAGTTVDKWQTHADYGLSRSVVWRDLDEGVAVDGWQQHDGTLAARHISVYLDDAPKFTSSQARAVAALLTEAADELDRLDRLDG